MENFIFCTVYDRSFPLPRHLASGITLFITLVTFEISFKSISISTVLSIALLLPWMKFAGFI